MIEKKFKPITESRIQDMEEELKVSFPSDYKSFLLEVGGGVVDKDEANSYIIPGINEEISVDTLFGDSEENSDSSSISYWMEEFKDELLEDAVIIGDDLMQGFIVLICAGNNEGVYYWDDSYNFDASDDDSNLYKISNSFQNFIERLI